MLLRTAFESDCSLKGIQPTYHFSVSVMKRKCFMYSLTGICIKKYVSHKESIGNNGTKRSCQNMATFRR